MGKEKGDLAIHNRDLKKVISNLVQDYSNSGLMESDFADLEPRERMQMAEKFMQYCLPKMQSVAVTGDENTPVTIEAKLLELSKIPTEK